MLLTVTLNDIARGDASPGQARGFVADLLERASRDMLLDLYHALRSWVWKALDQRRRDAELRDWHDIIASSATVVGGSDPGLGAKLDALHELLSESIAVSMKLGALDIHRRQHVTKALDFLAAHGGAADRECIGGHLGLAQANLTRVLNLMMTSGLLERSTCGKRASFRLTRRGVEAAPPMQAPTFADAHIQARAAQRRRAASAAPLDDSTLAAVKRVIDTMMARGTNLAIDSKGVNRIARLEGTGGNRFMAGDSHLLLGVTDGGTGHLFIPTSTPVFTANLKGKAELPQQAYSISSGRPTPSLEAAGV